MTVSPYPGREDQVIFMFAGFLANHDHTHNKVYMKLSVEVRTTHVSRYFINVECQ
jgi:hypothetical protein